MRPHRTAIRPRIHGGSFADRPVPLVGEGATDKPILEAIFAPFRPEEHKRIVVNGSVAETGQLLPMFYEKAGLPYVVYLDSDSGGRDIRGRLTRAGIPERKIIYLGDVVQRGDDFELEDLVDPALYHAAVRRTYPETEIDQPAGGDGKQTKKYEREFRDHQKMGFNKRRVAENLKSMLLENPPDAESLGGFRTLVDRMWRALNEDQNPHH
jgi:hypothetical protein